MDMKENWIKETFDTEIWKDIKGYEGLYQVSNFGRVKSLNYRHTYEPRLLKPYEGRRVLLWKDGKGQKYTLSHLVAEHFFNRKTDKNTFIKIATVGTNVRCQTIIKETTRSENPKLRKELLQNGEKLVMQLSKEGEPLKIYESVTEAAKEMGVSIQAIAQCIKKNKRNGYENCIKGTPFTAKGFVWKYVGNNA